MKREFVQIAGREYPVVRDTVLLGDWEEVQAATGTKASAITKNDADTEVLDGLVIRGYEMKWGVTNENGERYEKTAFDGFINDYFVKRNLNMPVDINHEGWQNYRSICGRVLYIETNTTGFYFVVYINRGYADYERVKWYLEQGIIQGFSKEGYTDDWELRYKPDGSFDYELIKSMKLLSVSLVATPANGISFEKLQEVRNGLRYVNRTVEEEQLTAKSTLEAMFN